MSASDLEHREIVLGGAPGSLFFDTRLRMLQAAGYDIAHVDYEVLVVERGAERAVQLLEMGVIHLAPVASRHYARLADAGYHFWVDQLDFGHEMLAANRMFVIDNPGASAALICGLIEGARAARDPATINYALDNWVERGITLDASILDSYAEDIKEYAPFDGGWPVEEMDALLQETAGRERGIDVPTCELLMLQPLHRAQDALGIAHAPECR